MKLCLSLRPTLLPCRSLTGAWIETIEYMYIGYMEKSLPYGGVD